MSGDMHEECRDGRREGTRGTNGGRKKEIGREEGESPI